MLYSYTWVTKTKIQYWGISLLFLVHPYDCAACSCLKEKKFAARLVIKQLCQHFSPQRLIFFVSDLLLAPATFRGCPRCVSSSFKIMLTRSLTPAASTLMSSSPSSSGPSRRPSCSSKTTIHTSLNTQV